MPSSAGSTTTFPGIGSGIEIEFVDASRTGEYKLALRPSEKDALWVSGGGPTRWEQMGLATRDGSMVSDLAMRRLGLETEPMYMRGAKPFDRLRQYFDLRRPPEFKFEKLATEVETRILYNPIPLKVVSAVYRVGQNAFLIPLTVQIPATELSYAQFGESNQRATVEIYGKVEDLSGKVVYEFEDTLAGDKGVDEILSTETHFLYQKQIPLRPGRFKFNLVAKGHAQPAGVPGRDPPFTSASRRPGTWPPAASSWRTGWLHPHGKRRCRTRSTRPAG